MASRLDDTAMMWRKENIFAVSFQSPGRGFSLGHPICYEYRLLPKKIIGKSCQTVRMYLMMQNWNRAKNAAVQVVL